MKKERLILILFILLKFALQYLVIHPDFDLQRDEKYFTPSFLK
jgi:hypothetical protein